MGKQLRFIGKAAKRLYLEGYTFRASALAYSTLLCVVPFFAVLLFLITLFPLFSKVMDLTRTFLLENFLPSASNSIQNYLQTFITQAAHSSLISILFLLITVIMLMYTIDSVFDDIWVTEKSKKKFTAFLIHWLVLTFTTIIISFSLFFSSYLFSAPWFLAITAKIGIKIPHLIIISLLMDILIFSVFYIIVPKYKINWADGFWGGFITAVLFEVIKVLFRIYVQRFSSYTLIYGAVAIVPIFLIWLYICWVIILFGALLVYEKFKWRCSHTSS